jgi:hypothetical protein
VVSKANAVSFYPINMVFNKAKPKAGVKIAQLASFQKKNTTVNLTDPEKKTN